MARRTAAQIFRDLITAGFDRTRAIIMTAIGLAESGGDPAAVGDVDLQDGTWGPSVGIYQVRTLKTETGSGQLRDIAALTGDPARQAQAAWAISRHGSDFAPWTVYRTGDYRDFLGQATAAATTVDGALREVPLPDPFGGLEDRAGQWLAGGRTLAIQIAVVGLGLTLIGLGVVRAVAPQTRQALGLAARVRTRGAV